MILVIILICLAALIALLIIRNEYELRHFKVVTKQISSEKIKKDQRFVFITDLHERSYGKNNEKLIKAIREIKPDGFLVGGDMFVYLLEDEELTLKKKEKKDKTIEFIKEMSEIAPVYYAYGNHEEKLFTKEEFKYYRDEVGKYVTFLNDDSVEVFAKDTIIVITGLEIERHLYLKFKNAIMPADYIDKKVGAVDASKFNILLAHSPLFFENYVNHNVDLVLCGHYHGEFLISPQFIPFPKHHAGVFTKNNTTMLVSRGIGSHTVNLRIKNMPEINVIELKSK